MNRTVALYELEGHQHRGLAIGMARHETYAPFACNSPVKLCVEPHPRYPGHEIVYEKCQCGKVVKTWSVLPEELFADDESCA